MTTINLIPPRLTRARRARVRARRWSLGLVVASVASCVAVVSMRIAPHDQGLSGKIRTVDSVREELGSTRAQLERALAQADAMQRELRLAGLRARRADWSSLIATIADRAHGVASIERLELAPAADGARSVEIDGIADHPASPARLAMALAQTGMLERVEVTGTSRRPTAAGDAISFRIRALLSEKR